MALKLNNEASAEDLEGLARGKERNLQAAVQAEP